MNSRNDLLGNPEPEITTHIQRKLKREIPDVMHVARDVPKPARPATGYLSIRQTRVGNYVVSVTGDTKSSNQRISSLNELLTFVGDWASGQFNERRE
jgi:hypothetical protein